MKVNKGIQTNFHISGCFMDLFAKTGDIIKNLSEIANGSICNENCQRTQNCSGWNYIDGVCYMKNERTFLIQTNNGVVSGERNCIGKGKMCFINEKKWTKF